MYQKNLKWKGIFVFPHFVFGEMGKRRRGACGGRGGGRAATCQPGRQRLLDNVAFKGI